MGSMIDDELDPRRVELTATEATARRLAAQRKLGVTLKVSSYERSLYEQSAPPSQSRKHA